MAAPVSVDTGAAIATVLIYDGFIIGILSHVRHDICYPGKYGGTLHP